MKKILIFATVFVFSMVFINCSSYTGSKPDSAANSNTAPPTAAQPAPTKPAAVAQPSPTKDEKKPAGKSDADRMDDGKSDADRSNSNR